MDIAHLLCIGHRGAMGYEPENTLRSIRKALELGAPYVEIDVYCVDGQLVVIHDDRLERTTNGSGRVMEQSFQYLRSLDAGRGERIPTLGEVCELVKGKAGLNIELKGPGTAQPVARYIAECIDAGWNKNAFLISSFDRRELLNMRQQDAGILLGLLVSDATSYDFLPARELRAFSINPSLKSVTKSFVEQAHSNGFQVFVFTVNEPGDIARMHAMGVDGVFTNYPERVLDHFAQGGGTPCWT